MALSMNFKRRKAFAAGRAVGGGGGGGQFKIWKNLLKPRMLLVVVLLFCWDTSNGSPSSHIHTGGHTHNPALSMSMPMHSHHSTSAIQHQNLIKLLYPQYQRYAQMLLSEPPQSRVGYQMESYEDVAEAVPLEADVDESRNALIGGIGNGEMVKPEEMKRKKKQDCGVPTISVRSFMEPSLLKRSYFANTQEDVLEKQRQEESSRIKRETASSLHKRNELGIGTDGPLPWTCETKYEWEDKGADHYPRFVRTAECKSRFCFNGFFRCKPRRYKTKVLKRLTGTEVASCEEDDVSLPESLRSTWKFVTVTINLCCDCTTRVPGTDA